MMIRTLSSRPAAQHGVALIVGLLMLVVLAIIGISAMSITALDETMAGNMRDRELAFQSAESALRYAEQRLEVLPFACGHADVAPPTAGSIDLIAEDGGTITVWDHNASNVPDPWDDASWSNATAYPDTLAGVAAPPRYVIEQMSYDTTDNSAVYRITSSGVGSSPVAQRVVQSYFRKLFRPVMSITGTPGNDVVALGDGLLQLGVEVGDIADIDLSFRGWDPAGCASTGDDITVYFDGAGGDDTFLLANVADITPTDVAGGVLQDVSYSISGVLDALTRFKVKRVAIDNPGSTLVTIANTGLLAQTSTDNEYCINTKAAAAPKSVLSGQIGQLLATISGVPALATILNAVTGLTDPLIGPGGLIPLLPESAGIIIDTAGNDSYEIYSDTTTATFIIADTAGDDSYYLRGSGAGGLLNAPVVLDTGGAADFDVSGGSYLPLALDLGVLTNLNGLLGNPLITFLVDLLLGSGNCHPLDLLCKTNKALVQPLLSNILSAVGNLFGGSPVDTGGTSPSFQNGRCAPDWDRRLSWREIRPE